MANENSICYMLNVPPVRHAEDVRRSGCDPRPVLVADDQHLDHEDLIVTGLTFRCQWNNMAFGATCFKHVPSQILEGIDHKPRVGDVCVRFLSVTGRAERHASLVDLYNSNVAHGSALIAQRIISSYRGIEELHILSIPIHILVSEWNKSLFRFRELVRCSHEGVGDRRDTVLGNVTTRAYKNIPVVGDHLWFAVHCLVSKPHLVKQVLQIVGAITSTSGNSCYTGTVQATTVPRDFGDTVSGIKLYLTAKSISPTGNDFTVLGEHSGVTLGLIWAADEDELHDHLRNSTNCHYLHVGTEYGNTFSCNGFSEWRYWNRTVFNRMIDVGLDITSKNAADSMLSGNTGDSASSLCYL